MKFGFSPRDSFFVIQRVLYIGLLKHRSTFTSKAGIIHFAVGFA